VEEVDTDNVEELPRKKSKSGASGSWRGVPVSKRKVRKQERITLEIAEKVEQQLEAMEDTRRAATTAMEKMEKMFKVWRTIGEEMMENVEEWKMVSRKLEKGKARE